MSFLEGTGVALGVGIYTLEQAATLVRLHAATVDMLIGTPDQTRSNDARSHPIVTAAIDLGFNEKIVTFHDLMELLVAAELRREGVSWPTIRLAVFQATTILNTSHPLSRGDFQTDGRKVFLALKQRPKKPKTAVDLLNRQQVFQDVIQRTLRRATVERDDDGRIRQWYPLTRRMHVVLDPARRFGEPIDPVSGVPTSALAEAFEAEKGNVRNAAAWFGVTKKAVRDAIVFEQWLHQS